MRHTPLGFKGGHNIYAPGQEIGREDALNALTPGPSPALRRAGEGRSEACAGAA